MTWVKYLAKDHNPSKELLGEIFQALFECRYLQVVRRCDRALRRFPDNTELLLRKAEALVNIPGRQFEAIRIFETIQETSPGCDEVRCGLGLAKFTAKR